MNPNSALRDAYTARQIALGRYANMTTAKVLALLRRVEADTIAKLANATTRPRQEQLEAFLQEVRSLYAERYATVALTVNGDMQDLAANEAAFGVAAMERATVGVTIQRPTDAQLNAAVNSRPFQGRFLREWLTGLEAGAAARVRDATRIGFVEGESIGAMTRRVRAQMEISRRGAEAMVRTAVNHTAQAARREVFQANADIVRGEMYNSLLDARVTPICRSLSGNIYPLGKGPRPPQHINCRSYTSVVLKDFSPPERTSYADWFAKQPAARQDEILGKTKARLYREGKIDLGAFVDRSGKAYTIDELRRRMPEAFEGME